MPLHRFDTVLGMRALVGCGKDSAIAKYFLADMRRFVSGIGHNGLYLREIFRYFVVNFIKGHAVMNIAGSYHCLKHKTVLVAGGMRLIGELPLVDRRSPLHGRCLLRT